MRFGLILSEVGQGFRRNLSMVISVVLVTFISLTFFGAAILLQFQINQMKGYWYDRAQVAVYFCTDISPESYCNNTEASADQIAAVKADLERRLKPYIKQISFENHQQAFADYQKLFANTSYVGLATPDHPVGGVPDQHEGPQPGRHRHRRDQGKPGVESVEDQRQLLDPSLLDHECGQLHRDRHRGADARRRRAADLDHHPAQCVLAASELGIMRLVGHRTDSSRRRSFSKGVLAALIGSVLASGAIVASCSSSCRATCSRTSRTPGSSACLTRWSSRRSCCWWARCSRRCRRASPSGAT
jgi:Cell division protein